jgi:protein-tyrosine phosphatase
MISGLVAVRNFAEVQDHLYRGAQPLEPWEYSWLASIGVRVLVNLRAERDHDLALAERFGMRSVSICVADDHAPTQEQLRTFCEVLREALAEGQGVFFHCAHGHGRTSTFSASWSVWNGASFAEACENERERYGYELKHEGQIQALRTFAGVGNA